MQNQNAVSENQVFKPLLLGSTSRYRKALLQRLCLPFSVAAPECDETPKTGESPAALVKRLAQAKARSLAGHYPDHLIIGSDQVADLEGQILGKPGTIEAAEAQLLRQSGRSIVFRTGLCLLDAGTGACELDVVEVQVCFRSLSRSEIERYVRLEKPLDCAGSIKSEGLGVSLLEAVNTADFTALVGLPLISLSGMLRRAGMRLP